MNYFIFWNQYFKFPRKFDRNVKNSWTFLVSFMIYINIRRYFVDIIFTYPVTRYSFTSFKRLFFILNCWYSKTKDEYYSYNNNNKDEKEIKTNLFFFFFCNKQMIHLYINFCFTCERTIRQRIGQTDKGCATAFPVFDYNVLNCHATVFFCADVVLTLTGWA